MLGRSNCLEVYIWKTLDIQDGLNLLAGFKDSLSEVFLSWAAISCVELDAKVSVLAAGVVACCKEYTTYAGVLLLFRLFLRRIVKPDQSRYSRRRDSTMLSDDDLANLVSRSNL